jgi:apolipoprotein N-acyltransferase
MAEPFLRSPSISRVVRGGGGRHRRRRSWERSGTTVRAFLGTLLPDTVPREQLNLTSDAWFDGSRIPYLHLELAKLRTIEHRRFLVHATNTGVTAVFDPAGRTAFLLPARQEASGVARVAWMSGYTPYEAMGDVPLFVTTLLMLGMLFAPRRRR